MAETMSTVEVNQPTEASLHKTPGWFPENIARRIDQYDQQVRPMLIHDLSLSLGKYGFDHLIEVLNRPSRDRSGEGLSQNEKLRVMKELRITQGQLEGYLTTFDKVLDKAEDSPEYTQYTKSRKVLMSVIWETVSTEYEHNREKRNAEIEKYERIKKAGNERVKNFLDGIERKTGRIISDLVGVSKGNDLLKSMYALPSGVEGRFNQVENFKT